MKTFILSWEEYLNTGNDKILDTLPEGTNFSVLCSGESLLVCESRGDAKKCWKRLFPRSEITGIKEKA